MLYQHMETKVKQIDGKIKINNMEIVKGNLDSLGPKGQYSAPVKQPEIYPIDATKAVTIQELGIIFNALGVGMTEEFAKTHNLEHMLVPLDETKVWQEEK